MMELLTRTPLFLPTPTRHIPQANGRWAYVMDSKSWERADRCWIGQAVCWKRNKTWVDYNARCYIQVCNAPKIPSDMTAVRRSPYREQGTPAPHSSRSCSYKHASSFGFRFVIRLRRKSLSVALHVAAIRCRHHR